MLANTESGLYLTVSTVMGAFVAYREDPLQHRPQPPPLPLSCQHHAASRKHSYFPSRGNKVHTEV
jgi:hypothetical protein